jgi:hypothetical protein
MKGDFSRFTFKARKHFTRVLKQQGRVELDADWNEDQAIQAYLRAAGLADVIGQAGAPSGGFLITTPNQGATFQIADGRIYVDGILVENDGAISFTDQPAGVLDVVNPPPINAPPLLALPVGGLADAVRLRTDLVYLDIWEQHITALEDGDIREVALGGPDTATRLQTRWRVRWQADVGALDCNDAVDSFPPGQVGTGMLTTQEGAAVGTSDPCIVEPDRGGYRGLENRLYRVEIHKAGERGTAQFKWSSENGAVVYAVDEVTDAHRLTVKRLGRDAVLRLNDGQAVEIYSAEDVRLGRSGVLTTIDGAPNDLEIKVADDIGAYMASGHLIYIRRWDEAARDVDAGGALGDSGIVVEFSTGSYRVGDYWTIVARARTGEFEILNDEPPHGVGHHYARLALVHWWRQTVAGVPQVTATIADCRLVFPPLTKLTQLLYVSGAGQECMPGEALPRPLVVRVNNGSFAVSGIPVKFKVDTGASNPPANADQEVFVLTDGNGFAALEWTPDPEIYSQQVMAALWDSDHLQVHFNANLSTADHVAYQPDDDCDLDATTVQAALDELCRRRANTEPGMRVTGIFWERITSLIDGEAGRGIRFLGVFDVERNADGKITGLTLKQEFQGRVKVTDLLEHVRPAATAANMSFLINATTTENRITLAANRFNAANLERLLDAITFDTEVVVGASPLLRTPVVNDAIVEVPTFMRGLVVTIDHAVSEQLVNRATCYLTLEAPQLADFQFAGYLPLVLRAESGYPSVLENEIHWQPSPNVAKMLAQALQAAARYNENAVLVRLLLKGNFIYDKDRRLYLDGDAFGVKGMAPHDLRPLGKDELPFYSGDERVGGDFEMWVWVTEGEAPPKPDELGFVLTRELNPVFHEILSLALNRPEIQTSGLLPAGYQVDPNAPFNLNQARQQLRSLGLGFLPIEELAGANIIPGIAFIQSLEPLVMELIRNHWMPIIMDNVEYVPIPDDEFVPRLGDQPFAALICRRSHLVELIASGVERYNPESFTVL